jgi:hypothetical protein
MVQAPQDRSVNIHDEKTVSIIIVVIAIIIAVVVSSIGTAAFNGTVSNGSRHLIVGSFDVTQIGDLVENDSCASYHYKKIRVPQLTLSDMPQVSVYENTITPQNKTMWSEPSVQYYGSILPFVTYGEGCVWLFYKQTEISTGLPTYTFTGEYKIVVVE